MAMSAKQIVEAGNEYEKFCGSIISGALSDSFGYISIYTKNSNDLLASRLLKDNPVLVDKLRIKRNNQFPGKGSLPDLDYVIADKHTDNPIAIISIKGDPNDVKFYSGCWHDNEYRKMGVKYMVMTKDPKGTFALKPNGNVTKYFDFFEEDARLYVDYSPNGYPTSKNHDYEDLCSGYVVNPALSPIVQDIAGFNTDMKELFLSHIRENHPNDLYKFLGNTKKSTSQGINGNFFNWSSN
jgi:hypothetical protein